MDAEPNILPDDRKAAPLLANPAQEAAIAALDGPVLIISCPGSGKTTTLVRRIHHLIETGVPAYSILMVTFTRSAALEMNRKYTRLFSAAPGVTFATIHSLCFNILKREGMVTNDDVLGEDKKRYFLASCLKSHGFFQEAWEMSANAATAISVCKNNYIKPRQLSVEGISGEMFTALYNAYAQWLTSEHMIDFDDMLTMCLNLLRDNPEILRRYQQMFRYIQCDEYQDTNFIQRDILYLLSADNHNLCVVGDDDQSIYSFRGAKPEIMLSFKKDFPNARVIRMGTNYRSGQLIVDAAGSLIGHNKTRFQKDFVSQRGQEGAEGSITVLEKENRKAEMDWMVETIGKLHEGGTPYSEIAVLFRTNEEAQYPVTALSDAGIPYYSTEAAKTIYESVIFEDIKSYTALAMGAGSRRDLLRILNHPNRYFREALFKDTPYTYDGMMRSALSGIKGSENLWKYDKAKESIEALMSAFGPNTLTADSEPAEIFKRLKQIHYGRYLKQYAEFRNLDLEDLKNVYQELLDDARAFPTISEWFGAAEAYVVKVRNEIKKKDTSGVVITTMHRAKGLEWKNVFIIDADDNIMPHSKALRSGQDGLEEERRLFYVAMTRAKDNLYICSLHKPSRFIEEITAGDTKTAYAIKPEQVPKYFAGHGVMHKKYGKGTVVRYTPDGIVVRFPKEEEKTFKFPDTFARGLMWYV